MAPSRSIKATWLISLRATDSWQAMCGSLRRARRGVAMLPFVGNWTRLCDAAYSEFWRFDRFENIAPIGTKHDLIMDACIANMGGAIVTVLSPLMTR